MTTLFISDLHLDASRPALVRLFEQLVAGEARQAEALYILGDLFEAWVGDDDDGPLAERVAQALHELSACGVPIYFMVGNRDFLLGERYAKRCGMQLLEDTAVVDLYGTPTLLLHGDTLCTADHQYQAFRAQVRDPQWQAGFLAEPLEKRRAFAAQARQESQSHTSTTAMDIMDVSADAVADALRAADVRHLIHGHTHRPALHSLQVDGERAERVVLGDWYKQGSVLRVTPKERSLAFFAAADG